MRGSLSFSSLFLLVLSAVAVENESSRLYLVRMSQPQSFRIARPEGASLAGASEPSWLRVVSADGTEECEFGRRLVVQVCPGADVSRVVACHPLLLSRLVRADLFVFEAASALEALEEASRLASLPEVVAAYPVVKRSVSLDGPYAPAPNDPHFAPLYGGIVGEWFLEDRDLETGVRRRQDLNVRAAWPYSRGEGVTIAVVDVGIELNHADLAPRTVGAPHKNFNPGATDATPFGSTTFWSHGTSVAGLAAAEGNNGVGMIGVAPLARLASWVVITPESKLVDDEQLMEAYSHAPDVVQVQNHSWGNDGVRQKGPTALEQAGLDKAAHEGRGGRGVVMVRSAGNERRRNANVNDDGYPSDPRVIAVGAVDRDGRVANYSERGACVLVAAPGGEANGNGLFTTDLSGANGANMIGFFPPFEYLSDYVFHSLGFGGTSAATPLVSGIAALMLSANPELTCRDVQQILLLSARQLDSSDPEIVENGAGFLVSQNVGFGVPDAGVAAELACGWSNRPPAATLTLTSDNAQAVPDDSLRLETIGEGIPSELASIRTLPSLGPFADTPTAAVPLVYVGLATNAITEDLTGKAALIERGTNLAPEKINFAAQAGATFAVIYNFATNYGAGCPGGEQFCALGGTDMTTVPAVFIRHSDGMGLRALLETNQTARVRLRVTPAMFEFIVTNALSCEHVSVRLQTDHPLRGDLRVTLLSPSGTRSVLQWYNSDTNAGPVDWTYSSTHHFYESSLGVWTLEVSDLAQGAAGSVKLASLIVEGVPITDTDADGLDDQWELNHFGNLGKGPKDDPDLDGYSNAREQVMRTDPNEGGPRLVELDLSAWNRDLVRLSWPGAPNRNYEVWSGADVTGLSLLTNVSGVFPVTEWFVAAGESPARFFQVRSPAP